MARRLGAAPSPRSFGDSAAQAGARRTHCVFLRKLVRSAGIAPASPDWHSGILLLNDDRERSGAEPWSEPCATYDNKERTPLPPGTSNVPGRTRRISLADVSVFTGTPPTKPLVYETLAWDLFALNKGGGMGGQRLTHHTGGRNRIVGYSATGLQYSCCE